VGRQGRVCRGPGDRLGADSEQRSLACLHCL
jgi:hypothetical protein